MSTAAPDPELDYSQLRAHVRELHPGMKNRRSNKDLAREHARSHHRYHNDHWHEFDNAGLLIGPGTNQRRPSGWYTGFGVCLRSVKR